MTSSKSDAKKARERTHLEAFKVSYGGFPHGAIEPAEEPDFLVTLPSGGRLGIELTEFFHDEEEGGSASKAQESLQEKVTRKAIEAYESKGLPPVVVSLFWAAYDDIRPPRVPQLAQEVADVVAAHLPEKSIATVEQTGLPGSPLPDEVNTLHVFRHEDIDENEWNSPRAGYVPGVAQSEIQRRITDKEQRLAAYRRQGSAVWLVIVAEGLAPSSFANVESFRDAAFVSSFDEVFLFRFFDRDVIRLKLGGV